MSSRTSRGVPEWSGGKELYIGSQVSAIGKVSGVSVLYRDHRKGSVGPPGGATYPRRPHGLKWEGNQPLVGLCTPLGPPLRLGLETLGWGGAPLALGGKPPPLAAAPPPSQGAYIKGGGRAAKLQPWAPPSSPATPLPLAEARRSPAEIPLHPPPRRRAAGSPSTSPSPLLDQEGGDVAAPYVC